MLKEILQTLKEEHCKTKVIATHKMTDPQKKLWKAYNALANSAIKMRETSKTASKKFWNKVEGDIDDFDHQLRVNEDTWEIEVHEDDCDNCDNNED